MDELKVNIDLKPLSDEQIKENNFGLKDLWMVQVRGRDTYGPYDTNSLKEYAHRYQFLFEDAKVYNLEAEQWNDMFAISQFQRRKPQLVSAQNLIKDQKFFILYNGQKDGPHSQQRVQELLNQGHILPSTQISLDEGKSWIKLYEHHAFDRRTKKSNDELPFKPAENILDKVNDAKAQILKIKEAEDAIVELAFMGKGEEEAELELESNPVPDSLERQTRHNIPNKLKKSKRVEPVQEKKTSNFFWGIGAAVVLIVAIAFGVVGINNDADNKITEIKESKTSTPGIDNSERQVVKKPKKIKRSPASIDRKKKRRSIQANKMKKFKRKVAPKRTVKRKKRYVRKETVKDIFEKDIEKIDIDDPDVQEELTRQLAGEYDDIENEENEEYDTRDERIEPDQDYDKDYNQDEDDYYNREDEEVIEHETY